MNDGRDIGPADRRGGIGDNVAGATVRLTVKLFNSVARHAGPGGSVRAVELSAGSDVGDVLRHLGIPPEVVFLVLVNGRDVTPGRVGDAIRQGYVLEDGDTVAFTGPVPFSYGMGAPVV